MPGKRSPFMMITDLAFVLMLTGLWSTMVVKDRRS